MTFTFNDEYLLKSMMSLVRDESNRIVSLGLATHDVLKAFVETPLHNAIKRVSEDNEDKSVVLKALTDLHNNLNDIRLPGDFEKISSSVEHQLYAAMDVEMPETDETNSTDVVADDVDDYSDDSNDEEIKAICSVLDHITYELGKKGNHEAAYLVERTLRKIAALSTK